MGQPAGSRSYRGARSPIFLTASVVETFSYEKIADREYIYEACDVESASRPLQYAQPVPR